MKKRALAMIFAALMMLSMTGCGSTSDANNTSATNDTGSAVAGDAADEPDASADEVSDGVLGSYAVEIKGAKLCKDFEGNNAIMITYSWTNNSEETTSPLGSMVEKAFQDGVQIDTAIVDFEYSDGMSEVRPGTTVDVETIYKLSSDSTVEFEISAIEDMFDSDVPKETANFEPSELSE